LARDLTALMDALGRRRFAVAGHDTGMWRTASRIRDVAHQSLAAGGDASARG
jgi:pimeloyl-ACP methyl ester carboxylesterase